jgi:hypothetical protein
LLFDYIFARAAFAFLLFPLATIIVPCALTVTVTVTVLVYAFYSLDLEQPVLHEILKFIILIYEIEFETETL